VTHEEARELLELAAAEPDGLERLAAGDTADSGALAGHLAGCDACREEYGRLTRAARLLRTSLSMLPPPELRERTLARVAAEGRVRGPTAGAPASVAAVPRPLTPAPVRRLDLRLAAGWVGSLAAAVAVAVGLSWVLVGQPIAQQARADRDAAAGLARLSAASIAVDAHGDAHHLALTSPAGTTGATGSLAYSPSARELVVVSTDLAPPPAGSEYRCWVEEGAARTSLGRMYFLSDVAAWYGDSEAVANVPPGATFGVSLVSSTGSNGETVLTGTVAGS
jgi:hypothetical protein